MGRDQSVRPVTLLDPVVQPTALQPRRAAAPGLLEQNRPAPFFVVFAPMCLSHWSMLPPIAAVVAG